MDKAFVEDHRQDGYKEKLVGGLGSTRTGRLSGKIGLLGKTDGFSGDSTNNILYTPA